PRSAMNATWRPSGAGNPADASVVFSGAVTTNRIGAGPGSRLRSTPSDMPPNHNAAPQAATTTQRSAAGRPDPAGCGIAAGIGSAAADDDTATGRSIGSGA